MLSKGYPSGGQTSTHTPEGTQADLVELWDVHGQKGVGCLRVSKSLQEIEVHVLGLIMTLAFNHMKSLIHQTGRVLAQRKRGDNKNTSLNLTKILLIRSGPFCNGHSCALPCGSH